MSPSNTIIELRNYVTKPGQRDVLIELFERQFIEPQEKLGANVLGTFRNIDDPDRFVWLRGFADSDARFDALDRFYAGDVWKTHRSAANATMVDSDDVLLLRHVAGNLTVSPEHRAPIGAERYPAAAIVVVTTYLLAPNTDEAFATFFAAEVAPRLEQARGRALAVFATEHRENNYPRLPVREDETVVVVIARFDSIEAHRAHLASLEDQPRWQSTVARLSDFLIQPAETLRLQPTTRSLLR